METSKSELDYDILMGITLKSLRSRKSIKQNDLMEAAGVSRATWSRIENGQSSIDFSQLTSVTGKCFRMTLNEFFTYMENLDDRLKTIIAEEARDRDMESRMFLNVIGGLGAGTVVGFLAKLIIDELQ